VHQPSCGVASYLPCSMYFLAPFSDKLGVSASKVLGKDLGSRIVASRPPRSDMRRCPSPKCNTVPRKLLHVLVQFYRMLAYVKPGAQHHQQQPASADHQYDVSGSLVCPGLREFAVVKLKRRALLAPRSQTVMPRYRVGSPLKGPHI
jgi:hypothetical protein